MPDVMIFADSVVSPEMRHEVPIVVPDPFLYVEKDGKRYRRRARSRSAGLRGAGHRGAPLGGLRTTTSCSPRGCARGDHLAARQPQRGRALGSRTRSCRGRSRSSLPTTCARTRSTLDPGLRLLRRPAPREDGGRARGNPPGPAGGRGRHGRREGDPRPRGGLERRRLTVDGEPLTCGARSRPRFAASFTEHGMTSDDFIVSHGAQAAIGHDMARADRGPTSRS